MKKKNLLLIFVFVLTLLVFNDVFAFKCDNGQDYVACGYGVNAVTGIPAFVPRLTAFAIALMRVLIPVILIITGTIEMFKSIISGNQDNIPKGKKKIIGKFVGALLAFFVISFVTNIVKLIARGDEKNVAKACFNCFLNNKCTDSEFACQGTLEAKKEYIDNSSGVCSSYSESDCPTDRCHVCYRGSRKVCTELNDGCGSEYPTSSGDDTGITTSSDNTQNNVTEDKIPDSYNYFEKAVGTLQVTLGMVKCYDYEPPACPPGCYTYEYICVDKDEYKGLTEK